MDLTYVPWHASFSGSFNTYSAIEARDQPHQLLFSSHASASFWFPETEKRGFWGDRKSRRGPELSSDKLLSVATAMRSID
ncbi:hypothetical protein [Rhizobium favelukesii]|uniref:Uncharacterized protein n=1 Tax=Rhizobium favelukesii TaxID=348824 RepID=W6RK19_9HYPH|nr:hypothetical protein [Rhizobium favelukesii]MCS0462391.1 hypothetical protein [Rhizobium favelukesii]CDM61209.1 hypothetical protein LPU83_pLPU83c_0647 [Rhizobium favelukesii]